MLVVPSAPAFEAESTRQPRAQAAVAWPIPQPLMPVSAFLPLVLERLLRPVLPVMHMMFAD